MTQATAGALALHDWSAPSLLAAFARGELSPVEVTQSVLDQIARWEPQLHASYLLRPELALAQARASQARERVSAKRAPAAAGRAGDGR